MNAFHPSLEGAQHGGKSLAKLAGFAKKSGALGIQPSNFHLNDGDKFKSAKSILDDVGSEGLHLNGISAHCPVWVHTTAWTGSPTIRRFIPESVAKLSVEKIEQWAEDYILNFFDLCAELKVRIIPMFWGVAFGWELASGYPWGLWEGPGYDLVKEGKDRFVEKTEKIRHHANRLGLYLAHEIHPGSAAMCADDFLTLREICDNDQCLVVNNDPTHCWEGESWELRTLKVGPHIYGAHIKDHYVFQSAPLRSMQTDWQKRAMQFVNLGSGQINMHRYAELLLRVGYHERYCKVTGFESAPLVVEAESAFRDLDATSAHGIAFVRDNLTFPLAAGSFEDGMGEK